MQRSGHPWPHWWVMGIDPLSFIVLIYKMGELNMTNFFPPQQTLSLSKILHINPTGKTVSSKAFSLDWGEGIWSHTSLPPPLSFLTTPPTPHLPGASRHPQSTAGKQPQTIDLSGAFLLEISVPNLRGLREDLPTPSS